MIGDLKNGRTVHSLARLLTLYDVKLVYVSPKELKMPESVKQACQAAGIEQHEFSELSDEVVRNTVRRAALRGWGDEKS